MNEGIRKLSKDCIVVAIEDGKYFDPDLEQVEAGMTFRYRGESPPKLHQFAPHPMINGGVGFQVPDYDMDVFYEYFRVLADND